MADRTSEGKTGGKGGRTGAAASTSGASKPKRATNAKGDGKAAAAGSAKSARGGAMPKAKPRTKQPDLKRDLRDFASGRPQGWGHDDWLNFLESLSNRGHDVADREAIGIALEKERLDVALGGIKGIGPQKRQALAEKYGTLWALRNAEPSEIARVAGVSQNVAERIRSELP